MSHEAQDRLRKCMLWIPEEGVDEEVFREAMRRWELGHEAPQHPYDSEWPTWDPRPEKF